MSRLHRLVGIVLLLQSRSVTRAEDIANHFGISVRTAYRDLRALEQAGIPIAAEAGIGYSLAEGYHLPPVVFTREEASAMFIGGEFVERYTDRSLQTHARSALAKIRAVLPTTTRGFLEELEHITVVQPPSSHHDAVTDYMATVQGALVGRHVLRLRYYSNYRDSIDARDVEPLGMIYYGNRWHLIGFCRLRNDIRDFRVDRIHSLEVSEEIFSPREEFSLKHYVENLYSHTHDASHEVRVYFSRPALRFAEARHYYGLVEEKDVEDGGKELTFVVSSLRWIANWLFCFGPSVLILYPEKLRSMMYELARDVLERYEEKCEV